jgi:WS/DGAT/MGAT family acyltransferase
MQQLSGVDSFFLYNERGNVYNHVASLAVYDPSSAPEGKVRFKDILRHFSHRLDQSRAFRRRLVAAPHDLDRPYWIEDPDLDLEFHIRHIALPEPGDWRQLMIQVARIHSRPLDRSRPLWEAYVIEGLHRIPGLPEGSFAVFIKFHHAAVDGQAGVELLRAVHSLTPDPDPPAEDHPARYVEREPTAVELYSRAVMHTFDRTIGAGTLYAQMISKFGGALVNELMRQLDPRGTEAKKPGPFPGVVRAPKTRFNRRVSANRVIEAVALPLPAMKTVRARVEGATINDIFLAVVGGALRRYLESKQELPDRSMMALMPMNVRDPAQTTAPGNQIGGIPVALRTDLADPIERLRAVHAAADAGKQTADKMGRDLLMKMMNVLPNFAAEKFLQLYLYPQLNVTVSNVRGPDVPLYVAGARLVHFYPVSIASDYIGLNHTGFSYNGLLWISAVACRNMLPDPAFYAQCLRESFDELLAASEKLELPGAAGKGEHARHAKPAAVAPARKRAPRRSDDKSPREERSTAPR